jgi:hypothetical protein
MHGPSHIAQTNRIHLVLYWHAEQDIWCLFGSPHLAPIWHMAGIEVHTFHY